MKTYLVTGAAGFIGANYVKYMLGKYNDVRIVVLDLLTYAGYLGTIADDIDNDRCIFVKGDICDRSLIDRLFADYRFDVVVNFAAESHVDRSIENPQLFLNTNILGTQNLLDAARTAWVMGKDEHGYPTWRKGVRFHQVSTDEVYGSLGPEGYFTEETPLCPHSPYSASKTSADHFVCASLLGFDAFQETDVLGMTLPITKWSYQIRRPEDVAWAVARAFFIARTGRPGPVVLDFAKNAQIGLADFNYKPVNFIRSYVPTPDLSDEKIREAAAILNSAQRPMVVHRNEHLGRVGHLSQAAASHLENRYFRGGTEAVFD